MSFYKINDELEYNFYIMPKELLIGKYKKLSAQAKITYMLILDRLKISKMNTWINDENELYLIYKREELMEQLGLCEKTVVKILKELEEFKLIYQKRQGLGKPNLIFVYKIEKEQECQNQNCKFYSSGNVKNTVQEPPKSTVQELENLQCNNNNINNNNYNNNSVSQYEEELEELDDIKQKCELDYLLTTDEHRMQPIIENLLEIMYFSKEIKINNATIPQVLIRAKMKKLNGGIITYMIDKLNRLGEKGEYDIKNSTNFLISFLYNCITEYYSDSELMFKAEYG